MIQSIKNLVTEIGMPDPIVINPVEICPQALAKDQNCMFWAYIIFMLILLNPDERDHNVLVKRFIEKYPTKEALSGYVNGFKKLMEPDVSSLPGGKRKTRKNRNKKRKTYRKK
jgi:hypothetical protein